MPTYLSLLRGINVSGQKQIKMADLKALYESLGFGQVRTYIQSGNVLFESANTDTQALVETIGQGIREQYHFDVPVLVRTAAEIEEVISSNPFLNDPAVAEDKLHVTLLDALPAPERLELLRTVHFPPDDFAIREQIIYLHCPDGYGRTKLTNTFFESKLKVSATTRNWRTMRELHAMMAR